MNLDERIILLAEALGLDIKTLTEAVANKATVVALTQAEYDALPVKDPDVLYVVTA